MTDIVERLRKSAKAVRWTTEPPECAPTIEPDDAEEAADEIERLRAALGKVAIGKGDPQFIACAALGGEND